MKKIAKIAIILLVAVSVMYSLSQIFIIIMLSGIWRPPISQRKMTKLFEQDFEELLIVKNYLDESVYSDIVIHEYMDSDLMATMDENVAIDDPCVVDALKSLKKKRYSTIWKSSNTIEFQRWYNLDNHRGIVFSMDGNVPDIQFLTKLVQLSETDWYYYESDYNEWRLHNKK